MTILLQKICSPYNWEAHRHSSPSRHNCFTPSEFNQFIHSRYYYASDTLDNLKHSKYDYKTSQINQLKQRSNKHPVAIISTIQNRITERKESNTSEMKGNSSLVIVERKRQRKLCVPPGFWNQDKLRAISEGGVKKEKESGEEIQIQRTRKRRQCMIPAMKLDSLNNKKNNNLNLRLNTIEEDCQKE